MACGQDARAPMDLLVFDSVDDRCLASGWNGSFELHGIGPESFAGSTALDYLPLVNVVSLSARVAPRHVAFISYLLARVCLMILCGSSSFQIDARQRQELPFIRSNETFHSDATWF